MIRIGRTLPVAILALAASLTLATSTRAQSGMHPTIEGERILLNRTVGNEQWAITEQEDGTLTGNVFFTDGSPPSFVQCEPTTIVENPDPSESTYTYDCYGTDSCTPDVCPDWVFVSTVTVSGSFFEAPQPSTPTPAPTAAPSPSAAPTATSAPTATPKPTATPAPTPTPAPTATPPGPTPTAAPTPTARPSPTPSQTPKPPPLVITPDRATVTAGTSFVFVITGGVPPYALNVTTGGTVTPTQVASAGSPFTFQATVAGTSSVIVVDSATAVKTVAITVKAPETEE